MGTLIAQSHARPTMFSGMLQSIIRLVATVVAFVLEKVVHGLAWVQRKRSSGPNPFLEGNFGPVPEVGSPIVLRPSSGSLPPSLHGSMFARNGPNPKHEPLSHYHWFDGDGMVHSVRVVDGETVVYSNHHVKTPRLAAEDAAGKALVVKIGDLQGVGGLLVLALDKARALAGIGLRRGTLRAGTGNTALVHHAQALYALVENALPFALGAVAGSQCGNTDAAHLQGPVSLGSRGYHDYDGSLGHPFTAHPKVDAATGEMFFFGYSLGGPPPAIHFARVDPQGNKAPSVGIDIPRRVMMHDMALTDKHAIILDLPLVFKPKAMVKTGGVPFVFSPDNGARLGLLPRNAGPLESPVWYPIEPCFIFHTAAAWEEDQGNVVVMIAIRYPSMDLNSLADGGADNPALTDGILYEWRINRQTGQVAERPLLEGIAGEFCLTSPAFVGSPTPPRYVYFARVASDESMAAISGHDNQSVSQAVFDGIVKFDLRQDTVAGIIDLPRGRTGGEAVFVPSGESDAEDDGHLLVFEYDAAQDTSSFVVYSASSMSSSPVAHVPLGVRVPYGFHGLHIPQPDLVALPEATL